MKYMLHAVLAIALVLSLALLGAAGQANVNKGKGLYTAKCAQCHSADGVGKPSVEKLFNVKMRAMASKEVTSKTDDQLRKSIVEGNGKMKAVTLTAAEAADVLAYVRTLK